jgi:hypothetical protein
MILQMQDVSLGTKREKKKRGKKERKMRSKHGQIEKRSMLSVRYQWEEPGRRIP